MKRVVSTENLAIGGSRGYPHQEMERQAYINKLHDTYQIDQDRLEQIFEVFGTKTEDIVKEQGLEVTKMLKTLPDISVGEIKYIVLNEDILHLDDLILRRTMLGKLGRITPDSLQEISQICGEVLNWSEQETEEEINRFTHLMRHNHKMDFNTFLDS